MAFIRHVLPDSLAVAPIQPVFHHAPRFVRAVARDTGAAVLVHFAGRGGIGCPDGLTAVTCELALRIIIIIWDDALAHAVTTHAVGGAERLCVINVTGRATAEAQNVALANPDRVCLAAYGRRPRPAAAAYAFEPDSLKG